MQPFVSFTEGIDGALVVLYIFWLFFFGLVFYLLREGRREGYPLVDDITGRREKGGLIWIPAPKKFITSHGKVHTAPRRDEVEPSVGPERAVPAAPFPGSPLTPVGNPLTAGVGPGAYVLRADEPDMTSEHTIKIVPMRVLHEHEIAEDDVDPRGMEVIGADGLPAGIVEDLWVDRSEMMVRYIEVRLDNEMIAEAEAEARALSLVAAAEGDGDGDNDADVAVAAPPVTASSTRVDTVLMPMNCATLSPLYRQVSTPSILAHHFADIPRIAAPDRVTLREEDKIMAYFSAGELYGTPDRLEPLF